ncbi:MAG: diphosphomevalonate/mevalonate 3,5-bisphosphate decarboxylase family protein [Bdellovibrionales bacterium]
MVKKKWSAEAPSNIALIKYMGKKNAEKNIPDNPSISYTLPHLLTKVELELVEHPEDSWEPLNQEGYFSLQLGPKETQRYLKHFKMIKEKFGIKQKFIVRSANNFPENCGLASSASSFAALTLCSVNAFSEINNTSVPEVNEIAALSRQGSGSSCRSLMKPWCVWAEETVSEIAFPQRNLLHMVVVADGARKKVSSSQAHKNVSSSLLYSGREERARIRMGLLVEALSSNNWKNAFELCWSEFWDMHALFETSNPSFGYMNEASMKVLHYAKSSWRKIDDGPIVTMDAGPNVHLLFRREQLSMAKDLKERYLDMGFKVYADKI